MNWKEIQDVYIKSYQAYIEWNCAKSPDCPSTECYQVNDRDLYDFFDENEILVTIDSFLMTKPQRRKGRPKIQNGWSWKKDLPALLLS